MDIRGRTNHEEIMNCPDFKEAYKLGHDISDLVKRYVLANAKKTNMDFDYIIKTGLILFMAEMFSNLSKDNDIAMQHFEQVMQATAKTISKAYKFKKLN